MPIIGRIEPKKQPRKDAPWIRTKLRGKTGFQLAKLAQRRRQGIEQMRQNLQAKNSARARLIASGLARRNPAKFHAEMQRIQEQIDSIRYRWRRRSAELAEIERMLGLHS